MDKLQNIFHNEFELDSFKEYTLALVFLRYLSENKTITRSKHTKPEVKSAFTAIQGRTAEILHPIETDFFALYSTRHHPDISNLVDTALLNLESHNPHIFTQNSLGSFSSIVSYSKKRLSRTRRNKIIEGLLEQIHHSTSSALKTEKPKYRLFQQLLDKLYNKTTNNRNFAYTSPNISKLITELLDPHPGESIYDPKCGAAHLLISCGKHIQHNFSSHNYQLHGQEALPNTWAIAKLNMHTHGEHINAIQYGDYIGAPSYTHSGNQLTTFDIVLSSAPFSIENWDYTHAKKDTFKRFRRGIPPKGKGDWALILHMIESTALPAGRMAIHISQGALFREAAEWTIRKKLIDENLLEAVIGVPEKLSHSGISPTVILLFRKSRKKRDILFIDGNNFTAAKKMSIHFPDQLISDTVNIYNRWQQEEDVSYIASWDEVRKNNYNLSLHRYINSFKEEFLDLHSIRHERHQLKQEYNAIENEIDHILAILSSTQDKEEP
ncbi:N-6 DNA methylase [Teredinibacter sp. KSP-S5-2]|uniref:N-6 DNA methylase n=1 Tax=Teredinibacter sp. KSP-S5-2 TaxID=3034506 RepID=UPI002934E324|nr:N-6 DNA methylase [Teredinibacter sp. KSP-S5-2]WNO07774.1 N-6 DNA methylase [Teredinibacter sp. KSP-S5-2]